MRGLQIHTCVYKLFVLISCGGPQKDVYKKYIMFCTFHEMFWDPKRGDV